MPRKLGSPNHHLWRNGRLWWIAFTVHHPDGRTERVRRSLRTPDLELARWRRDRVLQEYGLITNCRVAMDRANMLPDTRHFMPSGFTSRSGGGDSVASDRP